MRLIVTLSALFMLLAGCKNVITIKSPKRDTAALLKEWQATLPLTFQANATPHTSVYDSVYDIAMNGNGDALVVWGNDSVFVSEYKSGVWTHPSRMSDAFTQAAGDVKVGLADNGDAAIVWEEYNDSNIDIFLSERRNGGSWSHSRREQTSINVRDELSDVAYPDLAMNASGETVICWIQWDLTANAVYRSHYRAGVWTHPTSLADKISVAGNWPDIPNAAISDNGDAIITWEEYDGSFYQAYKSEFRSGVWINPTNAADNISPNGSNVSDVYPAMNASGDTIVVWQQPNGGLNQIFKSEYRSGSWTHPTSLTDHISPAGQQALGPSVAISNNGDALISWQQSDGTRSQIFKSHYRLGSWTHPSSLTDNISPDGGQAINSQVLIDSAGNGFILWSQENGPDYQIFRSSFRAGLWTHPSSLTDNISPDGADAFWFRAAMSENGRAIVTWNQTDTTSRAFMSTFNGTSWVDPVDINDQQGFSERYQYISWPMIKVNNNGEAIIIWRIRDGFNFKLFKSEYRGGAWTHPVDMNDFFTNPASSAYEMEHDIADNGDAVIVWSQPSAGLNRIYKAEYRAGTWTYPTGLTDAISPIGTVADFPRVAMNATGETVITWVQDSGGVNRIFKSEYRGGIWTHPSNTTDVISPNSAATYTNVAMADNGDTIIAWVQSDGAFNQVFKSEYRLGSWTHPSGLSDNISPDGQIASLVRLKMNSSGDALIAWMQRAGSSYSVFKSVYASGSWTHPVDVNDKISPTTKDLYELDADIGEDGSAVIAWFTSDYISTEIYKATLNNGTWTIPSGPTDYVARSDRAFGYLTVNVVDKDYAHILWVEKYSYIRGVETDGVLWAPVSFDGENGATISSDCDNSAQCMSVFTDLTPNLSDIGISVKARY